MRILLVDDIPQILRSYCRLIARRHEVRTATGVNDALAILASDFVPDIVLCDYHLGDGLGLQVLAEVKARHPRAQRYLATGFAGELPAQAHAIASVLEKGSQRLLNLFRTLG